jgi:hypothetical protein
VFVERFLGCAMPLITDQITKYVKMADTNTDFLDDDKILPPFDVETAKYEAKVFFIVLLFLFIFRKLKNKKN